MIRISIRNFRTYLTREDGTPFVFDFQPGVNLLKGESGIGKTTIFHAIHWCLYKKPATGNSPIYGVKGEQTEVTLEIENDILVTRVSPRAIFTVKLLTSNQLLENEEAQIYIENRFGKDYVWKTCNYVSQGTINQLLSNEISESQKWEVLYNVSMGTQGASNVTIEGMKQKLKLKAGDLETRMEKYGREIEFRDSTLKTLIEKIEGLEGEVGGRGLFSENLENLYLTMKNKAKFPNRDSSTELMNRVREALVEGETKLREGEIKLSTLNDNMETMILKNRDLELELIGLKSKHRDLQDRLDKQLSYERGVERLLDQWEFLKQIPREKLAEKAVKFHRELTRFRNIYRLPEDSEDESLITSVERALVYQGLTRDIELKTKSFMTLNPDLPRTTNLETMMVAEEKLGSRHALNCPDCDHMFWITVTPNGVAEVDNSEAGAVKLNSKSRELLNQIRNLLSQRNGMEPPSQNHLGFTINDIPLLKDWFPLPKALKVLIGRYLSHKALPDVDFLTRSPPPDSVNPDTVREVETRISSLTSDVKTKLEQIAEQRVLAMKLETELGKIKYEIRNQQSLLSQLQDEKDWWSKPGNEYSSKQEVEDLYLEMTTVKKLNSELWELKTRIEKLQREKEDIHENCITPLKGELSAVSELKTMIEETESKYLSECVTHVTSVTNGFLENSFEKPLSLDLITEKDVKTTGKKKHSLNVKILTSNNSQTGIVERDLDGFSGGETDRISLGISLGISSLSPFPVVLLDECISSLDTEMKDKVIRALRQQAKLTNKSIVLICHDALEGLFDNVVYL